MKKAIVISLLFCSIFVMGCSLPKKKTVVATSCKQAILTYLQTAQKASKGDAVKAGQTVVVDYIGRLDAETVFDTSVESVAQACGKYTTGRNYAEGLSFQAGGGQMIAGFDAAVVTMKVGETKTISIAPKDAYGEWDDTKLVTLDRANIPNAGEYKVGMKVMAQNGQTFTIYKVTDSQIVFDANHELAGKTLIFDITVKSVK